MIMDKEYFRQIGREVGKLLAHEIKAPPEGHPFYGNQWINFGGGASGGNAPKTVAAGEVFKPFPPSETDIYNDMISKISNKELRSDYEYHEKTVENYIMDSYDKRILLSPENARGAMTHLHLMNLDAREVFKREPSAGRRYINKYDNLRSKFIATANEKWDYPLR